MTEPDRSHLPSAEHSAHEAEMTRLRQERDALRAALAGLAAVPHGTVSPQTLRQKRQWFRVQRCHATQQRRRGGEKVPHEK